MNLETKYIFEGVTVSTRECNNTKIIASKVKITSKHKQNALNKANEMPLMFMQVAQIEAKKTKKQNFFNKHKNN